MSGVRYHLTDDGPKFCTATVRDCPIGGAHFTSKEDADAAFEFRVKQVHSPFSILRKKKKEKLADPHTKHVSEAEKRIQELSEEMAERDRRQKDSTLFYQLMENGVSADTLESRFKEETQTRKATIGYGKVDNQESPVVGMVYGGDYKEEEEKGMAFIARGLSSGEYAPEDVQYYEKDGYHFFAVRGRNTQLFGTGIEFDPKVISEAKAIERFNKQAEAEQFERKWELEQKDFTQLKEEFKGKLSPLPRSKEKLIEAALKSERPAGYRDSAIGEFQSGEALVIVTQDPIEAKLMAKLKDAHDAGALRIGGPANPYGRGSLFYDDRDLSSAEKSREIRTDYARKYAMAYVSETEAKMRKMHGTLSALTPRVDDKVQDVREVSYWLDWAPSGRQPVTGLYTKEQLDRMADGNFSDVKN